MPIYEYECGKCGVFEQSQRISEPALTKCPTCRRKVRRLISSTSFQLDILDATAPSASPLPLHWRQQLEGGSPRSGLWSFWRFAADDKAGQLLLAEPVRVAPVLQLDQLGAEDVAVERVRAVPVGDGDHAVVEAKLGQRNPIRFGGQ